MRLHHWRITRLPHSQSAVGSIPSGAEIEVRALIDEAEVALGTGDWPRYAAVWAHEPWIELLHPAEGEWLTGWGTVGPSYRALIASGPPLEIERRRLRVRVAPEGLMAWAVAETVVRLPDNAAPAAELWITYVLEQFGGKWHLVHGHASVPRQAAPKAPSPGTA